RLWGLSLFDPRDHRSWPGLGVGDVITEGHHPHDRARHTKHRKCQCQPELLDFWRPYGGAVHVCHGRLHRECGATRD
ncbi:hypothetical protein ABTH29_20745, partial [Acinetobacter baumannii]